MLGPRVFDNLYVLIIICLRSYGIRSLDARYIATLYRVAMRLKTRQEAGEIGVHALGHQGGG